MNWTVLVAKAALKQLARFPAKDQDRIAVAISALADDPFGGDIIKLEGGNRRWRRRAGSYRILLYRRTRVKDSGSKRDSSPHFSHQPDSGSIPPAVSAVRRARRQVGCRGQHLDR